MANSYLFTCFARSRVSGTNVRKRSTNFPREDIAGIRSIGGEGKDKHNRHGMANSYLFIPFGRSRMSGTNVYQESAVQISPWRK